MIKPKDFYNSIKRKGISFFTGVPDSTLKDFCSYVQDNEDQNNHIISANEGGAVALAAGHYLVTGKPALVYMQNSGQGNSINPLISLLDKEVYNIPALLLIGWRGNPYQKDAPQHTKQGKITLELLDSLKIPNRVLPDAMQAAEGTIEVAMDYISKEKAPYAIVVKKEMFEPYESKSKEKEKSDYELSREEAIKLITSNLEEKAVIISTTGKTSRELFEYRESQQQNHKRDFLNIGAMGHASQIALGVALAKPDTPVYCLDGDGSLIMHMGSLAVIGQNSPSNFKHIVLNNGSHESVGGQPTAGFDIDILGVARSCRYHGAWTVNDSQDVLDKMKLLKSSKGPSLLEIKINKESRKDLGRPTISPKDRKDSFMNFLKE
jgi:phosphonopyruvate decarboxylase